jgi:hypothetical protein
MVSVAGDRVRMPHRSASALNSHQGISTHEGGSFFDEPPFLLSGRMTSTSFGARERFQDFAVEMELYANESASDDIRARLIIEVSDHRARIENVDHGRRLRALC